MPAAELPFDHYAGGIKQTVPVGHFTLSQTIALIRSDTYEVLTNKLRSADSSAKKRIKSTMDYVTWSGRFAPTRLATNIVQHSGYICLDYDHVDNLWETRLQLQGDPHTAALFVSPSGDGLKLIVEVKDLATETDVPWPDRHKEAFVDLVFYFRQHYGLEADASGSDVSRACFLCRDPSGFLNPDRELYVLKGLATKAPPKPKPEYKVQQDASESLRHATTVVERIEAAGVDIADEYHNDTSNTGWLLVGFALSTYGEDGRELFHRISQISPKYDQADTDTKFTNALQKCRFTTPAIFFTIAKRYGIDVGKKKREKASTKNAGTPQPPDPQAPAVAISDPPGTPIDAVVPRPRLINIDSNGTVTYDRDEYEIRIKAGKSGWNTIADNFLLYIKYMTEDENENLTWVVEIQADNTDPIYVEVPHEEFNSASKLKRILSGKQFALKISDSELSELHGYLFARTRFHRATKIIRYGYHAPSGVFFFANKALNGSLLEPDQFGMVRTQKDGIDFFLSMPANNRHKAHRFTLTDHQVTVNQFFPVYAAAHGYENALIPFCFYMMALYRDLALKHKNFSPILFLKGGAGTGKSSMIRVLTSAFGRKQDGVNLKSKNTETALAKLMSQASNTIIWFDEFHNDISCEGLLQAAYDNDGYHLTKAGTVGTNETDSIDIYSALALTSNYLPDNPIFFSRCVFVAITSQDKSDAQVTAYNQLEVWQEEGLGCLTLELLQYRTLIEEQYAASYALLLNGIKKEFKGEKIPERFFANMAQLLTVGFTLAATGKVHMTQSTGIQDVLDEFVAVGAGNIRRQFRIVSEKTALSEFLEIVQQLFDQYQIHDQVHFDIVQVGNELQVELWFPQLYNLYAMHYRRMTQRSPADRDSLQQEIAAFEEQPDWDAMKKSIRFHNDGEGNAQSNSTPRKNCCVMNYSKLKDKYGLDLETRKPRSS